ncbi:MAG: TolC family outer membrane protein [Pseudomonadota bacterium]
MIGRSALISSCAVLAVLAAHATPVQAESLEEEIAFLLRDNPTLKSLRNQVEAAEEGINEAFAGYLPTVDVSADYGYETTDSPQSRITDPGDPLELSRARATATLRQNIFDGYNTSATYDAAQITRDLSELTLEDDTQRLILEGVAAYLDVLRALALIDLSDRNVDTIATQLNLENERVERGSGLALDVLQAKTRLQLAEERRVAFEGTLQQAIARYNRLFGHPPDIATMELPRIPEDELPFSLDDAIAIGLAENPQTASSHALVLLADETRDQARSAYWPRVDLVGRLNLEDDVDGIEGVRRDAAILVEANWQLFAGFANQANVAQSAYEHVAAIHERAATNRQVIEDVELAWEVLQTSRERVELLENAVNIAIEVHDSRRRLREAGQETVLNVLDAENDVFNAQINLVGAQYDGYLSIFRLLEAMGRLTPERLVPGLEDTSSIGVYDGGEIELATSSDQQTIDLVIEPLGEATDITMSNADDVQVVGVTSVQIAASSEPFAWSADEYVMTLSPTTEAGGTGDDPALFTMAPSIQSLGSDGQPTDDADGTAIQTLDDPNLTRGWAFE